LEKREILNVDSWREGGIWEVLTEIVGKQIVDGGLWIGDCWWLKRGGIWRGNWQ
jgi:hypothetical protein